MKPNSISLFQPLKFLGKGVVFQNTNGLQQVNTKYNIRGWLSQINEIAALGTDLFAFKINYNNPDANYQGTALYNGNISQTHWRTSSNNILKSYGYTYDDLNRLLNAKYYAGTDPANTDRYNENLQYDKNGNITNLNRRGAYSNVYNGLIDQLSYSYTGNQLINVTDSSSADASAGFKDGNLKTTTNLDDYQYDDFGNMTIDRNKGITGINYNHLNLPNGIVFNNNLATVINYTYNASGAKVSKYVNKGANSVAFNNTSETEYLGGYQYNNGVLQFFPHAQGYVKYNVNPNTSGSEFDYVYQYKDHLGNIRVNYAINPATQMLSLLEENNYYPFGLKHTENLQARTIRFSRNAETVPFTKGVGFFEPIGELPAILLNQTIPNSGYQIKFQGQEFQDELGLNAYFFKYRTYYPDLGRFLQIDPIAESYVYNSTYAFAENKVVESIDLEGRESWYTQDGSLATGYKGPLSEKSRKELGLYSPSELQQLKAKESNNNTPHFTQDNRTHAERKANDAKWRKHYNDLKTEKEAFDNYNNIASPHTAKRIVKDVATEVATGVVVGKVVQGAKALMAFKAVDNAIDATSRGKLILNTVNTGQRTSSAAYKSLNVDDAQHFFSDIIDNYASEATQFSIKGGDDITRNLFQIEGSLNGNSGIFEWIVDGANVTHRRFIPNGVVNGMPNQIVR